MDESISTESPVLVVGAGNCGLAIASGLQKAEVPYILFERDTEDSFLVKSRDWGMLLHWGDEYLRKVLPVDLAARLVETTVDPHYDWNHLQPLPHVDADTGEIGRTVEMPIMTRVSRKRLRRFLSENQKLNIRFDKRLKNIKVDPSGEIKVEFEDGSRASGACLIGSDGSKSRVREYLCGERARLVHEDVTFVNHVASYTAEQAVFLRKYHPIVKLAFAKNRDTSLLAIVDGSDKDHPENWKYQIYFSWRGPPYVDDFRDPAQKLQFFKKRASSFCEPWRTAALALKEDEIVPIDPGAQFSPYQWDNRDGKITLAGDAAHAMLPHRGQGLNNAMKDASELVDALSAVHAGQRSLKDAIGGYEAEMIPRGATEVGLSSDLASKRVDARYEDEIVKLGLHRAEVKM